MLPDKNTHNLYISFQQDLIESYIKRNVNTELEKGRTQNILLNLTDMIHTRELLTSKFAQRLNKNPTVIESMVAIFPTSMSQPRGFANIEDKWPIFVASDMKAMYWVKGYSAFRPLPGVQMLGKGKNEDTDHDETDNDQPDHRPDTSPEKSNDDLSKVSSKFLARSTSFLAVSAVLGLPNMVWILPAVFGICVISAIIVSSFMTTGRNRKVNIDKKYPKDISEAVQIYKDQMRLVIQGNTSDEAFTKSHEDVKNKIADCLLSDSHLHYQFKEVVDDEFKNLSSERWIISDLNAVFDNKFYTAVLLFLYLVSRLTSKVILVTCTGRMTQQNVVAIHVSLLSFCYMAETFFQIFFHHILSSPFKIPASFFWMSLILWSLYFILGHFPGVGSGIVHMSDRIWNMTEKAAVDYQMNTPKRIAITMFAFGTLRISARFLTSVSVLGDIFTGPANQFKPLMSLVKAFAFFATFGKVVSVVSFMLAILLIIFAVELISNSLKVSHWLNKPIANDTSLAGVCDTAWMQLSSALGFRGFRQLRVGADAS